MILGVDHIALSVSELEKAGMRLADLSFKKRFAQRGIINAPAKSPLLASYQHLHDIAVFDANEGIAIELTAHSASHTHSGHLGYVPVLNLPDTAIRSNQSGPEAPPHLQEPAGVAAALLDAFGIAAEWHPIPELDAAFWTANEKSHASGVTAAAFCVRDLERTLQFFCKTLLAIQVASGKTGKRTWAAIQFASPVPRWRLRMLIYEGANLDEAGELSLDCAGFPCITLLTSNIHNDVAALAAASARPAPQVFSLSVNDRPLDVAMLRGPAGEIIELIQLRRS